MAIKKRSRVSREMTCRRCLSSFHKYIRADVTYDLLCDPCRRNTSRCCLCHTAITTEGSITTTSGPICGDCRQAAEFVELEREFVSRFEPSQLGSPLPMRVDEVNYSVSRITEVLNDLGFDVLTDLAFADGEKEASIQLHFRKSLGQGRRFSYMKANDKMSIPIPVVKKRRIRISNE